MEKFANKEYVLYRQEGVCQIDDICERDLGIIGKKDYYVLVPVNKTDSSFFVPCDLADLDKKMRKLISKDDIDSIIADVKNFSAEWIEDSKKRSIYLQDMVDSSDRVKIIWVIRTLAAHRIDMEKLGKTFYATDRKILESATKMITDEFSFVLGIPRDSVMDVVDKFFE